MSSEACLLHAHCVRISSCCANVCFSSRQISKYRRLRFWNLIGIGTYLCTYVVKLTKVCNTTYTDSRSGLKVIFGVTTKCKVPPQNPISVENREFYHHMKKNAKSIHVCNYFLIWIYLFQRNLLEMAVSLLRFLDRNLQKRTLHWWWYG